MPRGKVGPIRQRLYGRDENPTHTRTWCRHCRKRFWIPRRADGRPAHGHVCPDCRNAREAARNAARRKPLTPVLRVESRLLDIRADLTDYERAQLEALEPETLTPIAAERIIAGWQRQA